ncbi:MAG: energy-coupling factor transporter transmembrane component T family protein [Candidatus Xenobia bacterium]
MDLMRSVTVGQYLEAESPLHEMDPRTKLLGLAVFMTLAFLPLHLATFGLLLVATLIGAALGQVPMRFFLGGLRSVLYLVILTVACNILFTRDGTVVAHVAGWPITDQGLLLGELMAVRVVLLVLGTSLLTLTTSPIRLTDGLERLGRPLRPLGVPVHEMALMVSIALRFIPTLMEQAERLMKAQAARGADFSSRHPLRRARALVPVLVPLFVQAFRAADELADAMEARGYRPGAPRTRAWRQLAWRAVDGWGLVGIGLLMEGVGWLERWIA